MRRFVLLGMFLGAAALSPLAAEAAAPERVVSDTVTYSGTSPCGPVTEVDVGRITSTTFFNTDGTVKRFVLRDPAITSTFTLKGGNSLTFFVSNIVLISSTTTTSPNGSTYTEVDKYVGLNYIYTTPDGRMITSAGRGTLTYMVSYDARGKIVSEDLSDSATPNLAHVTDIICA